MTGEKPSPILTVIRRLFQMHPGEGRALFLSGAYFFLVLSAWYVLRPIRDEMAVAGGVQNLPYMFTGTLILMVLVNPLFAGVVSRFPRNTFVAIAYRFFMLNLVTFFFLWRFLDPGGQIWLGRAFYWWGSVFNLFVVSIFWAFMSDVWRSGQSKRLYGIIGVGGTVGAISGASVTGFFATRVGEPINLVLVSVVLLEIAVWVVLALSRKFSALRKARGEADTSGQAVGGSVWAGLKHLVKNPMLAGIGGYVLFYTVVGTVLYFARAELAAEIADRRARTAFLAQFDVWTNGLTLVTQMFLTSHVIRKLGMSATLAVLPVLVLVGFLSLGFWPTAVVIIVFQGLRRATNFSIARPAKETLFTLVNREDRFKAKPLIDTLVYRAGDQIGAWGYAGLGAIGLTLSGVAFAWAPLAGVWAMLGFWLGRQKGSSA
ncbi:MAG: MFS transporter [Gemmatimonadetes bacterium]|nr:MFS transporter [Gemmatimonadota bacterium]